MSAPPTPQAATPGAAAAAPRTPATAAPAGPAGPGGAATPGLGTPQMRVNPSPAPQRPPGPQIFSSPGIIRAPSVNAPNFTVTPPRPPAAAASASSSMPAPSSPYRRSVPAKRPTHEAGAAVPSAAQSTSQPRAQFRPKRSRLEPRPPQVIFERLHSLIPESRLYSQLLDLERQVDRAILRKQLDIQEAIRVKPARSGKVLRVYVSNSFTSQGPSYHADEASASVFEPPSWVLRIEGLLVDPTGGFTPSPKKRFTAHVKRLFVQMTDTRGVVKEAVEWSKGNNTLLGDSMDGFEIKRRGTEEMLCRILIWLDWVPERFRLSQPLSAVLGMHTETRSRVLMALWQYIKLHKLQDQEDRKIIHNNAELKAVFGCDSISFTQIPQLINDHLLVPEPVEIQYTMKLHGDPLDTEEVWDIPFEVEESVAVHLQPAHKKELDSLEELIGNSVRQIQEHKANRDFLLNFANSPADFINAMVSAQTRDWTIANSQDPKGADDEERFVSFYYQPLVHEAVSQYLAKNAPKQ